MTAHPVSASKSAAAKRARLVRAGWPHRRDGRADRAAG
jgi:hypothetical protein